MGAPGGRGGTLLGAGERPVLEAAEETFLVFGEEPFQPPSIRPASPLYEAESQCSDSAWEIT